MQALSWLFPSRSTRVCLCPSRHPHSRPTQGSAIPRSPITTSTTCQAKTAYFSPPPTTTCASMPTESRQIWWRSLWRHDCGGYIHTAGENEVRSETTTSSSLKVTPCNNCTSRSFPQTISKRSTPQPSLGRTGAVCALTLACHSISWIRLMRRILSWRIRQCKVWWCGWGDRKTPRHLTPGTRCCKLFTGQSEMT